MILVLDTAGLISYANRRCSEAGYREQRSSRATAGRLRRASAAAAVRGSLVEPWRAPARSWKFLFPATDAALAGNLPISLSPMRDEQGEINSVVVVMSDITDSADLQAKLVHTEKMAALGQLVSGVAHEVNNPLAAIVGFTDLLLENPEISRSSQRRTAGDSAGGPAHPGNRSESAELCATDALAAGARADSIRFCTNAETPGLRFFKAWRARSWNILIAAALADRRSASTSASFPEYSE